MQPQHPDDRFPLTQHERDQFNRICQELAGGEPDRRRTGAWEPAQPHPAWSAVAIACTVFVFIGLAVNSVFLVVIAAAGAVGPYLARRGR
ncbi:hypothetical protein JCM33774_29220 [Actinophytocola sp. KF-1]